MTTKNLQVTKEEEDVVLQGLQWDQAGCMLIHGK